jgi:hypothetical protein
MRLAFDSRPATGDMQGLRHYSRCLLQALRDTAGEEDEILEGRRPHGADVFHTPWMQGAMLHSPCPMVVTLHDFAALKRTSERLRCGGMHLPLRHLAVQRATHVIVPDEAVAGEAVAELGLEHERVIVIAEAQPIDVQSTRTWEDAARETWAVYRRALSHPHRPCITTPRRRLRRHAASGVHRPQ